MGFNPRVSRPEKTSAPSGADLSISPSRLNYEIQTIYGLDPDGSDPPPEKKMKCSTTRTTTGKSSRGTALPAWARRSETVSTDWDASPLDEDNDDTDYNDVPWRQT